MFYLRAWIARHDVGHRVGAAFVADKKRVTLREIAGVFGRGLHVHEPAIAVLRPACGDSLRDDGRTASLADMDHLGAGVGLLHVVGQRDGIEFADAVLAAKHAGRVFPGDGGTGLDLRPGDLRPVAAADAALGDEIVDPALAVLVPGVPVLDRRVLDLGILQRHQLDNGGVKLVFVTLRCRAPFEIAYVAVVIRNDEGAFELAGVLLVDPEIGRQFHRAADALRNVDEGPVGEDGRVKRREIIVANRDNRTQIALHQLRIVADRLGNRAEDDAGL